jgi:hypothetical protein
MGGLKPLERGESETPNLESDMGIEPKKSCRLLNPTYTRNPVPALPSTQELYKIQNDQTVPSGRRLLMGRTPLPETYLKSFRVGKNGKKFVEFYSHNYCAEDHHPTHTSKSLFESSSEDSPESPFRHLDKLLT